MYYAIGRQSARRPSLTRAGHWRRQLCAAPNRAGWVADARSLPIGTGSHKEQDMPSSRRNRALLAALILFGFAQTCLGANGFSPTGNMGEGLGGRYGASDALLPDGRVLIAGGFRSANLATAEYYNPV